MKRIIFSNYYHLGDIPELLSNLQEFCTSGIKFKIAVGASRNQENKTNNSSQRSSEKQGDGSSITRMRRVFSAELP